MFGIIERFDKLRSNTAIDLRLPNPACPRMSASPAIRG